MKVENRKLFSNRDARSKLANMGGIMTSSPELMGEAQRFAEGSKDAVAANNGGPPLTARILTSDSAATDNVFFQGLLDGDFGVEYQRDALRRTLSGEFGSEFKNEILNKIIGEEYGSGVRDLTVSVLEDSGARVTQDENTGKIRSIQFPSIPQKSVSPFGQESVDQLGAPSLLQQFRQTEMPSNRLGGSPDSEVLRAASPQGLGLESLDLVRPSGDLSIDQMMNTASTRSAPAREGIETLSAPTAEFVPRFPGDTQFQQDMVARDATPPAAEGPRTLGDVVEENPQTANRQAALDKLKEQFSNMSLFPDSDQRGENLSRFLDGAIDTPSGAVSAPQTESEQLLASSLPMNVAADSGPESGMFSDDVKGGFNIMPPAAYDAETPAAREAEGESLLSSVGNTMRSNPLRDAIAAGRVTMANTRAEEAEEQKQAEITESAQLLAAQDQQRDAQRMMEINATPPATPPDGYQIITNRSGAPQSVNQNRINPEKIAKITKRFANGEITEAQYQGQKTEYDNAILQDNAHKAYSADQQAVTDAAKAKDDAAQAAISEATLTRRIAEAEKNNDTALVEALLETKKTPPVDPKFDEIDDGTGTDFKQIIDLNAAQKVVDPLVITKEDGKDGTATGGNGNSVANSFLGTSGTPTENVAKYEARFKDMLGIKDEDKAKEMWHNMSMIGFAIAAGQDPNALANVANGMLAGTKMMKEDRATNQAREDKIKVMAYNAEREDTQADLKYKRDVDLLGIKGANAIATAGAGGAGSFSTPDRLWKSTYDTIKKAKEQDVFDKVITQDEAIRQAKEAASKAFPNSQFAAPVVTEPEVPNPKVVALVADLKTKGSSDAKLRAQLIAQGLNPATYGV